MTYALALLSRLGLFNRKSAVAPDQFDLRLERSRAREGRCAARAAVFRNRPSPLEA